MAQTSKIGIILHTKCDKTAVVLVERLKMNPKYKKKYKVSKKFLVHNPENQYQDGEMVKIQECRPYSRRKRFIIIKKITKTNNDPIKKSLKSR